MDQLKNLARIPDSVCLEVRVMDWIINFRSALFGILVFHPLFCSVAIFWAPWSVCVCVCLNTLEEKTLTN